MFLHLLVLILPFHHAVYAETMSPSRLTFGSTKYDLTRLSALTLNGEGTTPDHYRYALNPCGLVPATSCGLPTTPRAGAMAC